MPYRSDAQRRYFHYALSKGKLPADLVKEYDDASRGMKLPEKAPKKPNGWRGMAKGKYQK